MRKWLNVVVDNFSNTDIASSSDFPVVNAWEEVRGREEVACRWG